MMLKKVFIVTGRTGAGKSTLCKKLEDYFSYPLLSFASMGKSFANKNGYQRIRQCHLAMELNEFKTQLSSHISNIIDETMTTHDYIIIDGLYIDEVLKNLNKKYDCKILYLKLDDNIRYERVSNRLSITLEEAKKENKIKERLKDEVGIHTFIQNADIVIDGNRSIQEVFEIAKKWIQG